MKCSNVDEYIEKAACLIGKWKQIEAEIVYQIGAILNELKSQVSHGSFKRVLYDKRVEMNLRAAELYMKVARAEDGREIARYGLTKAIELLRISDMNCRAKFMAEKRLQLAYLSKRDLKAMVDQYLGIQAARTTTYSRQGDHKAYQRGYEDGRKTGYRDGYEAGSRKVQPTRSDENWAAGILHLRLDVPEQITFECITAAFRRMAKMYHPDKHLCEDDESMKLINIAFDILRNRYSSARRAA